MQKIGLPKGGSLEKSCRLLSTYLKQPVDARKLHHTNKPASVHFYLLKQRDIPWLVRNGVLDLGITTLEWIEEKSCQLQIVKQMDWCDTRISLLSTPAQPALRRAGPITCVTEFPTIARKFFEDQGIVNYVIKVISGSCEGFVPTIYDCAIDCVETGASAERNGLREEAVMLKSKTVLIARPNSLTPKIKQLIQELDL